jgi:hypothetical protein
MLEELKKKGITLVILLDEVHHTGEGMVTFITTYQHLLREGLPVALLMAGLPSAVEDVLNDKVLTFFRRANRVTLKDVDIESVRIAFNESFGEGDRSFASGVDRYAAEVTEGFPYLIQLVGYYLWKSAGRTIDAQDVDKALAMSKVDLYRNIHDLMIIESSSKDQEFLRAMAEDDGISEIGQIIKRMGVNSSYASQYRERLLKSGIIAKAGYGKLTFTPPYMRDYLRTREW